MTGGRKLTDDFLESLPLRSTSLPGDTVGSFCSSGLTIVEVLLLDVVTELRLLSSLISLTGLNAALAVGVVSPLLTEK